jgi:hypothetical protein
VQVTGLGEEVADLLALAVHAERLTDVERAAVARPELDRSRLVHRPLVERGP